MEMHLCYINKMGINYRGENLYEFIFTTRDLLEEVDGESWDKVPADGHPAPPETQFIKNVGSLTTKEIIMKVVQDSNYFGVYDSVDGIIALGWEHIGEDFEGMENIKRLSFHYGETLDSVSDKLYTRDLILTLVKEQKNQLS